MMDLNNAVSVLMKGVDSAVTEAGFTLVRPENIEKDALPITVDKETEKRLSTMRVITVNQNSNRRR